MTKTILATIKALLSSKKFVAALIAALVWLGGKVGLHVDTETMAGIVGPIVMYVLGQGVADAGKTAAQITADSKAAPSA
jgi:hypothetical protein